jgi:GNAT superfamily N-acetyltransferase
MYGGMWGSLAQRLLGWAEGPPPAANAAPQAGAETSTGYTPHVGDYVSPAWHKEHPNEKPPVINIMTAGQKPGTITVHNPITQLPGETYADTVHRAVDAAKSVTPEQIDEEKEENLLNAPATLATAYTLGRLGPVIYGGAKGMSVLKQAIAGGDSQVVGHPENMMTPDERKAHPYFSGLLEEAGNMSNPEMLAMLVGGGQLSKLGVNGMKLTSRLVAGGFSTTMIANTIKQVPDFIDVMKGTGKYADMDTDERESIAKNMVFHMTTGAAFATQAGEEALTGKTTPVVDTAPIKAGIKSAADAFQGKAGNVVDATMRTLNVPERQRPAMKKKVESVQNELENIFTKNKDTIEDPATFADAIEKHNQENEAAMQRAAGVTRDSAEPVVPDFSQRVSDRLNKLFADTKGQFPEAEVAEAKKNILERILQSRNGQHMQEPNLFEAENVRKGLNDMSQTAFDPVTKKFAPKNALQTAAFEAANATREAIDQSYHTHGVENVQEFREKEAPLIDVVKGLRAMQGKAEAKGQPGWFKAAFNTVGAAEGMGALATAIFSGHPLAAAIGLPALLANKIHQNVTNPIANIQRIGELANPNAPATEVNVRPTPPTTGASPTPAPLPVTPNPTAPAPVATPIVTPPAPPEINHELHRALATHYDELVGQSTYNELKGRFQAELEAKTRDGKRLDLSDPLKKLVDIHNKGITDTTQKNIEAQRKQAEAEAKAAQVAQAEAEKEKEEKAASGQITTDHPPFATENHITLPKWAQDMGYTPQRVVMHELAHMLKIDDSGIQTGDIINHKHPKVDEGSLGEARWDKNEFSREDGTVDPEKLPDVLDILHMGPVAEELGHGVPLHENPAEDLKVARKILTEAGIKPAEAGRMMKESEMRARAMLNEPGVMDVLKRYSDHREKGTDDELHMSSETVGRAMQEIRHARGKANESNNEAQPAKGAEKVNPEAGAGGEGKSKGEPKEKVQPAGAEGAAAGEGGERKGTEPRTNLKPESGVATADREEDTGGGATTSHERTDFGGIIHLHEGDKVTGRLKYGLQGDTANLLGIEAPKGKGYGQKLLDEAMDQARSRGAKTMEAGTKNTLSMDAAKMLDRAGERGVPVQKIEGKIAGSPAYKIDLNSGAKGEPTELRTNLRPDRVSTRVPTAKPTKSFTPEEHMGEEPLTIGREAVDKDPRIQQKLADVVSKYPGFKIPKGLKDPVKILDSFTSQVKDNLLHLWDSVAPEKRTANAKWYESVNKKANDDANEHGIEPRQAAGVYASLSPQKDWDMNASLAKRVMDTHFNHANDVGTPKMTEFGQGLVDKARADAENKMAGFKASGEKDPVVVQRKQGAYERKLKNAADLEKVVQKIAGQKYSDLTDPYEKGVWVRLHDEVNNPRNYPKIDPGTGNPLEDVTNADGSKSKVAWGSMEPIARAVSILQDGSRENISEQLGGEHKVRNFYNNIIDPTHPEDVTIDTHAVAAGHMQPFSGQSKEVTNNFGSAGKSAQTGVHGSYPLYAEAYRQAAKERGVKAREMQSVTWEKIRELFPSEIKDADFQRQAQKIMKKVSDGKITAKEARKQVTDAAVDKRMGQMAGKAKKAIDNPEQVRDNDITAGVAALGGK